MTAEPETAEAQENVADANAFALPLMPENAPKARKKAKIKTKQVVKLAGLPPMFWAELRLKYETGEYSQRDLVNYSSAKGFRISQARISQRVIDEEWIRGSVRDGIRNDVMAELQKKMGDDLRAMLTRHSQQSSVIQSEAVAHLQAAALARKGNPAFVMPVAQIETIVRTLKEAHHMEARAMGWNYKEGKPFEMEEEEEGKKLPTLKVERMTEEEEKEIRDKAEKALQDLEAAGGAGESGPSPA